MTSLTVVDHRPGETRAEAVARRLRGELGQLSLSGSEAARRVGLTQAFMSRRLTGHVSFHIDELDLICTRLGISYEYVTTGMRPLPRVDSNHQPFGQRLVA
jgi:transcriptional regulator with XRE-family HTH domain